MAFAGRLSLRVEFGLPKHIAVKKHVLARRRKNRAGFQGEPGAFSQSAARKLLGEAVLTAPFPSFRDVFEALGQGLITHAVIPIENTLHGSVLENYDHIVEYGFPICGETGIRISHQLIAMNGVTFRDVRRVFSHPVALNQCRHFFQENPQIEPAPFYDTAGSVKMLSQETLPDAAAIASVDAARIYSGKILRKNIEDNRQNFTRFFLLTKQNPAKVPVAAASKVSVTFSAANTPGALFRAMSCLALRDLNIIKIESRPLIGKPWEYRFYLDFLGSLADATVKNAIANLAEMTQSFKVLGNYEPTP
jgi:prephenate dehydratase